MEKKCKLCGSLLAVGKNWRNSAKTKKDYKCVVCKKKYDEIRYLQLREKILNDPEKKEKRFLYKRALKTLCIEKYGRVCACCGEDRIEFLTLDHIGGRSRGHEIDVLDGVQLSLWLKRNNFPSNIHLRVLCCNCNFSIGAYGYCPHQPTKPKTYACGYNLSRSVVVWEQISKPQDG